MNYMLKCDDCEVNRVGPPIPGSCPCCFGPMKEIKQLSFNFRLMALITSWVKTCINPKCRRCCSSDYLSGYWSRYHEEQRTK
jgi:hypothetical protein